MIWFELEHHKGRHNMILQTFISNSPKTPLSKIAIVNTKNMLLSVARTDVFKIIELIILSNESTLKAHRHFLARRQNHPWPSCEDKIKSGFYCQVFFIAKSSFCCQVKFRLSSQILLSSHFYLLPSNFFIAKWNLFCQVKILLSSQNWRNSLCHVRSTTPSA